MTIEKDKIASSILAVKSFGNAIKGLEKVIYNKTKRKAEVENAQLKTERLLEELLKKSEKRYLEEKKGRKFSLGIGLLSLMVGGFILITSIVNILISLHR